MSEAARPAGPARSGPRVRANVFNEGRPFSVVYPLLVLLAAGRVGLAPDGLARSALAGAGACALVLSRFSFALRGRALLWLAALAALPLLEPWRAPALLAGALAGYVFFTVVVWGSVYYHLRTGAPWTNGLRFWRLVLTNSDPTSGNALEQLPKLLIALSAGTLLAEEASAGSVLRSASPPWRSPRLLAPSPRARSPAACRAIRSAAQGAARTGGAGPQGLRDRRGRLQPRPPVAGTRAGHGPARARGHGVPRGGTRISRAHGGVLLVDAHRRDAGRARDALELRSPPRRAARVGLRRARSPRPPRPTRGDRAPARPVRRGGRALGDLGAADLADRRFARGRGPTGGGGGGPRPARAPAARRRPARPRARRAQPRVPRPDRGDRPPRGRLPPASSRSAAGSTTRP